MHFLYFYDIQLCLVQLILFQIYPPVQQENVLNKNDFSKRKINLQS